MTARIERHRAFLSVLAYFLVVTVLAVAVTS